MLSIARKLNLTAKDSLSIGMETNSKGFLGFIIELPGAYVRGPTQNGAVSKTVMEAGSYLTWLGQENVRFPEPLIVQTHRSDLKIEAGGTVYPEAQHFVRQISRSRMLTVRFCSTTTVAQ